MSKSHNFKFSVFALLAGLLVLMTLNADAAGRMFFTVGGPDAFGYSFIDSKESGGPTMNWENIGPTSSTAGTSIFGTIWDDSTSASLALGFTFPYYGTNYTTCYVGSNGYIGFGTAVNTLGSPGIPSTGTPNPVIAVYMGDLHSGSGSGQVLYRSFTGSGNDHFIVQWDGISHYSAQASSTFTFQAKIYSSGQIVYNYLSMSGTNSNGNVNTIGIENQTGTVGMLYRANGAPAANAIATGLVVQFGLGADPNPPTALAMSADPAASAQPNNFISDATVFFRGTVTDPDAIQTVGVQVEILPAASPFVGVPITGELAQSNPLVPNGSVAEAAYTFTGTPYGNGSYHWRIRSVDQFGRVSAWVIPAADTFQVDIVAPALATLTSPSNGLDVPVSGQDGGVVGFTWIAPVDAGPAPLADYDIEIASDSGFTTIIAGATVASTSFSTYIPTSNNFYYWRVRTRDSVGNLGAFTTEFSFRAVHDSGNNASAGDAGKVCGSGATPSTGGAWAMFALLAIAMGWILRR